MKNHLLYLFISIFNILPAEAQVDSSSQVLVNKIRSCTEANHLQLKLLDHNFSEQFSENFLEVIDPEKIFITREDIELLKIYQLTIDDDWKNGTLNYYNKAGQMLRNRVHEAQKFFDEVLKTDLIPLKTDSFDLSNENREFVTNYEALKRRWMLYLKWKVTEAVIEIEETENGSVQKNVEANVRDVVRKRIQREYESAKVCSEEILIKHYVNTYLKLHDVQSEYLSASEKELWDQSFSRSFAGIGVEVKKQGIFYAIGKLTPDGPAAKSGKMSEGDLILTVSDSGNKSISITELSMEDVVTLLRGPQGSPVRLGIKNSGNELVNVDLVRSTIVQPGTRSFLLSEKNSSKRIGYLQLSRFYEGDKLSSSDVAAELEKLKDSNVEGIIFDVRNNQGGSAREAVKILGLFLDSGIVMQAAYKGGNHRLLEDSDGEAKYKGGLVVLVNSYSASASELFAGSMQDYGRAIIVGTQATFGKGTIQRFYDLDTLGVTLGAVKLTIGSFYTASGRSAQYHGIQPDITLPDIDDSILTGERIYGNTLKLTDLKFQPRNQAVWAIKDLSKVKSLSQDRVFNSSYFKLIKEASEELKWNEQRTVTSLNIQEYKKFIEKRDIKSYPIKLQGDDILSVTALSGNREENSKESETVLQNELNLEIATDPYIRECYFVIKDALSF